ncbi:diguanylate cyclase (GGDEF)-like protein/PAS domain S-box-containing protein [Actimicrobium sp. GrIS 1.19]|uniref:sensor domain-containing protein n=1 Tax=Actimicrobium sp. GrIS 1.19 TaxID=3071708 RepID=UPI002DF7DFE6|nr:diguanylate cyclase (GGDEF)-like protein/PAS domain S-box-containing protein [Actimicrobium sp. GrIS 1.19]
MNKPGRRGGPRETASESSAPGGMPSDFSREHFKALIESSDDAIISKDMAGNVTSWNAGAEALFGYSAEEMIGRSLLVLFPFERRDEETLILNKILAGEKVENFETVRRHRDGHLIDVSVTISPIRDGAGRIIGASKIARDVSERLALTVTALQFEAIVASSDDAIISKSLDGTILSWNAGAQAMFGFTACDMIGQSIHLLVPRERQAEENDILLQLRAGQKVDHIETVRRRKDGRLIDVSVTSSPIRNTRGKIIGASMIARDITAQKRAEARLQLTARVFSSTHEGILITDANGLIVEVNESFLRISGYRRDELLGQSPLMFSSSRQGPEVRATMWAQLSATGSCQGEAWSRRKDGQAYAGLLSINSIRDNAGRVQNYVALVADITPLRAKQEELERLLHFDPLTKLANRILLGDRLQQAMLQARRAQQPVTVLYLDLDRFKLVNDTYGHDIGDQVLVAVSHHMLEVIRDTDTLARMGGDEFVVVLQGVGTAACSDALVGRILRACARPVVIGKLVLQVSASIGMTVFPDDEADADQLIRHADQAMFIAKREGRNRIYHFDPALEAGIQLRNVQLSRIAQAIVTDELVLFYQPKVNMRLGTVTGMEALIRWRHPERGLLPPAAFLPVMQDDPLETTLGEWVILQALAQMSRWQADGLRLPVSVNIAASQLLLPDFAVRLGLLLERFPDVDPGDLELEILETSALHDLHAVAALMQACHALGVHFAIDDFGTGYSALTYLRRLPAETLKIDQTFVRDMLIDHDDLAIVQSVIALADVFQRSVIAEGVESMEIGERLLDLGCDIAQGYAIARPLEAAAIPEWLVNWQPFASWKDRPSDP